MPGPPRPVRRRRPSVGQRLGLPGDAGQRRPQFVGHRGQKVPLAGFAVLQRIGQSVDRDGDLGDLPRTGHRSPQVPGARPIARASPAVRRNGLDTTLATNSPTSTAATSPPEIAQSSRRSRSCRVAAATSTGATSAKPPSVDRASTSCSSPSTDRSPTPRPPTARRAGLPAARSRGSAPGRAAVGADQRPPRCPARQSTAALRQDAWRRPGRPRAGRRPGRPGRPAPPWSPRAASGGPPAPRRRRRSRRSTATATISRLTCTASVVRAAGGASVAAGRSSAQRLGHRSSAE